MAKIVRKNQKIFADVTPTDKLGQFGSYAAGSPAYSNDPDTLQALTAYGAGLSAGLVNNAPPAIEDMDGLIYLFTRQLAYLFQAGIPEYNSETTYYIGSIVSVVGQLFMSVSDDNIDNDISDGTNWVIYKTNKVIRYTYDLAMASYDDYIIEMDGTDAGGAGTLLLILPTPTAAMTGRIIIVKDLYPTASGYVQVQAQDSTTIDGASFISISTQYETKRFICTGTKWETI
jgi:hypothetical protein